jgi:hypothetical protein
MEVENKNKALERELTAFEKRYKGLRWAQHILFWVSVLAATVPALVVALTTGLVFTEAHNEDGKWHLAGFAIFVLAIGALLMLKGLRDKFRDKMPWSVTAAVGSWVMTGFIYAIHKIVEDALWISLALAIGCTVASVLSAISDLCKTQADAMQQEYYRRQG